MLNKEEWEVARTLGLEQWPDNEEQASKAKRKAKQLFHVELHKVHPDKGGCCKVTQQLVFVYRLIQSIRPRKSGMIRYEQLRTGIRTIWDEEKTT